MVVRVRHDQVTQPPDQPAWFVVMPMLVVVMLMTVTMSMVMSMVVPAVVPIVVPVIVAHLHAGIVSRPGCTHRTA